MRYLIKNAMAGLEEKPFGSEGKMDNRPRLMYEPESTLRNGEINLIEDVEIGDCILIGVKGKPKRFRLTYEEEGKWTIAGDQEEEYMERTIDSSEKQYRFGRNAKNDFVMKDKSLSRFNHFLVTFGKDSIEIIANGSNTSCLRKGKRNPTKTKSSISPEPALPNEIAGKVKALLQSHHQGRKDKPREKDAG